MELVGTAQQNADVRAFLQKKVDEVLDLFSNSTARSTPDFADEVLAASPASTSTAAPVEPTEESPPLGRLLRRDMDPNRNAFSQRVERQMANTGMTEEEAQQTVRDRRAARKERLANLQEELGLTRRKARGILRYGDRNRTMTEDGTMNEPDYKRARRVVDVSRRTGLKRSEVASILKSRAEKRRAQQEG